MRVLVVVFLIWAIIATGIAINQAQELQKLKKEVTTLKWYAYTNKTSKEELMAEKSKLQETLNDLKNENENLRLRVYDLEKENGELRSQLSELYVKVAELESKLRLYEQVPHGYYSTNFFPEYQNTVEDLKAFLSKLKIPHKYERGVFDCSEISAYVEWVLEDAGFDAYIVLGEVDFGGDNKGIHAWNMVKVAGATYYIDMSSGKPHIFKSDKHHLKIIKVFKNIYEAIEYYYGVKEWDWWNVVGFPPKNIVKG